MSVMSLCGVGFVCICAVIIVRENGYKSFSIIISCICSLLLLIFTVNKISGEYEAIKMLLVNNARIKYIDVATKAFGTAFVCEVCSDFIRELGSDSIAKGLETAGKAEILILCIAPLREILTITLSIAGQA